MRPLRRTLTLVAVLGLLLVVVAPVAVGEEEIRTDTGGLAGYNIVATASPLTVRLFETSFPIPAHPGTPNFEVTTGHSSTSLGAGPISRAVASVVWPGSAVGDGYGTIMEEFGGDPEDEYPIRANAEYPGGDVEVTEDFGIARMHAVARGLDVEARTQVVGELVPDVLSAGLLRSRSLSTIEDGVARAVADAALTDVQLLDGLIVIDELRTRLVATSDGIDAEVRGGTEFSGLSVAGTRFALGSDGATVVEEEGEESGFDEVPALPLRLRGIVDLSELIGVTAAIAPTDDDVDDEFAAAGRTAGGVVLTIDATRLFEIARLLPLDALFDQLPDDVSAQLRGVLGLGPTIEVVLGRAVVDASGTEPLSFDLPDMDFDAPPPMDDGFAGDDLSFDEEADFGFADTDLDATAPPADLAGPDVASQMPPGAEPPQAFTPAASFPDPFGGLPAPAILLSAIAIAFAGLGLQKLTGAALAVPIAGAACTAPSSGVPDLRQQGGS